MTDIQVTKIQTSIEEFGKFMEEGVRKIQEACKILVTVLDVVGNREGMKLFVDRYPTIPRSAWARFEAVGRGSLKSELLFNFSPGAKQLRCMPVGDQEKYLGEPVELLTHDGDTLRVSIQDMDTKQAKQVFASDHVRSLSEQRAYIESVKTSKSASPVPCVPYHIKNKNLIVNEGGIRFTAHQLRKILKDMDGQLD